MIKRFRNKKAEVLPSPSNKVATVSQPLSEPSLIQRFQMCHDVKRHVYKIKAGDDQSRIVLLYCDGLCDNQQLIQDMVLPHLTRFYETYGFHKNEEIVESCQLQLESISFEEWEQQVETDIFEGKLLLFIPALTSLFSLDISKKPARKPEESNIEVSIRGPKDGFVEEVGVNVALIRKRIKSTSMVYETKTVGVRTKTTVAILYMRDIVNPNIVQDIKKKLDGIQIDGAISATQLEELMEPTRALFPLMGYTGRPDFTVNCMMNGRVALIVDGTPAALIAPANLFLLLKTPEDIHFTALSATFGQTLRLLGLSVSLMLPGFWVAILAYHQDQLPYYLLATIGINRLGIPLGVAGEMFLSLIFLEILREAGVRLPSAIGSTVTVVGGLILGDAAIRAGFLSPSIVVIGAITQVFGSTLSSQSLSGTISILRFIVFILSAALGIYGFFLALFIVTTHLASLRSCGLPYLAPLSPPYKDFANALFRLPWRWRKTRPDNLNTHDPTSQGDGQK
ncbi:spore germination protein [Paenibacillus glucanolyticus]|uniref:spore germination protein n=1 Tax=Paenibacillus glucanolyticus TaxID=59843 RepID=UPI002115CDF6|nr:spore germination protein [Paenibacillus glucanolyticus]